MGWCGGGWGWGRGGTLCSLKLVVVLVDMRKDEGEHTAHCEPAPEKFFRQLAGLQWAAVVSHYEVFISIEFPSDIIPLSQG